MGGHRVLPFPGRYTALTLGQRRLAVQVEEICGNFVPLGSFIMDGSCLEVRCHAPMPTFLAFAARFNHRLASHLGSFQAQGSDIDAQLTSSAAAGQPYVSYLQTAWRH